MKKRGEIRARAEQRDREIYLRHCNAKVMGRSRSRRIISFLAAFLRRRVNPAVRMQRDGRVLIKNDKRPSMRFYI